MKQRYRENLSTDPSSWIGNWRMFIRSPIVMAAGALITVFSAAAGMRKDSARNGQDCPGNEDGELEAGDSQTPVPRSGEVDLRRITPGPAESGEPVVQPAPGAADPSVRLVQIARQSLAAEAGRDISEIALVGVEAVDWPDSSLGCPQEGRMYLQVITPGYRITLELDGVEYRYHTDRGRRVVNCPEK